ncbi:MAG: hypothetical protein H7Z41_15200 [Cytophagales bacterium]|nr:hypothetical protein [Armatimonadota bacterium]
MRRVAVLAVAAFACLALVLPVVPFAPVLPAAHAQIAGDMDVDGSLGDYWSGLYRNQAMRQEWMGMTRATATRRRTVRRVAPAPPVWKLNPGTSPVIRRIVATAPPGDRPATRAALVKMLGMYPAILRVASKAVGTNLRLTDAHDTATVAGVMVFQELSGKQLTNAQFAAERAATRRSFAARPLTVTQMQEGSER